jgi:tetratricopeptide (TPR) repeat protein
VSKEIGLSTKAEDYFKRSIDIYDRVDNRVGLAGGYGNIGIVYRNMGNYEQALNYHNKALEIDTKLNDIVVLAKNHYNEFSVIWNE